MTPEQLRLKEIGERVAENAANCGPFGLGITGEAMAWLYRFALSTIAERDEARKLCSDYRDTYGGGPKDPLPWEPNDKDAQ